ncbi:MAG: hypothetical protein OQJ97_09735 [Rhodospirillales bacterium]|nr:hypothetical protein [Rhodospirillales bacterium]
MNMKAITIYRLEHARAALKIAAEYQVPVILLSPLNGAQQMGAEVFQTIIDIAGKMNPKADYASVLDCGDEPGLALNALRLGIKAISIREKNEKVIDIANQTGAVVFERPKDALDLLPIEDFEAACLDWLST